MQSMLIIFLVQLVLVACLVGYANVLLFPVFNSYLKQRSAADKSFSYEVCRNLACYWHLHFPQHLQTLSSTVPKLLYI